MQLVSRKNWLLFLAALSVVLMGIMAYSLGVKKPKVDTFEKEVSKMQEQSPETDVNSIEKDLKETDLSDIDKELQDIDKELNKID